MPTCLHNYRMLYNQSDATVEVCVKCKRRLVTRKDQDGNADQFTWLREHERDFLQPTDPRFGREYRSITTR